MRDQIWNTSIFFTLKNWVTLVFSIGFGIVSIKKTLTRFSTKKKRKKKEEEDFDSATINEDII